MESRIPNDSINGNLDAIPQGRDAGPEPEGLETGGMNEADAKEAGYIDDKGQAVAKTREDRKGSPTGAYTDVGAGRSSAVRSSSKKKLRTDHSTFIGQILVPFTTGHRL